jgi:hypothetical protein
VNQAGDEPVLRPSLGGVVDFALASYARRAPFYLALALLVLLVGTLVEVAIPAAPRDSDAGQLKLLIITYASVFVDAYVVAAISIGIGTALAKETISWRRIARAAAERWLPVLTIGILELLVVQVTVPFSGLGPRPDDYPALLIFTAPLVWLLWGVLALAAPIAALSGDSPMSAFFTGITRAVMFSLRRSNFARLCVVAFASVVPTLLQDVAYDLMVLHHVPRPIFWANVPIDALTIGPVTAIQAAFALDFARRAGLLEKPPA